MMQYLHQRSEPINNGPKSQFLADVIGWDILNWSTAIEYWEDKAGSELTGSYSLEIGAGNSGGLSLWLASRGSNVVCLALGGVSDAAEAIHDKYELSGQIEYQDIDALSIPYVDEFDLVVFKSVLGAIGRYDARELQERAILQMHKALKAGGKLLYAENLACTRAHQFLRRKYGRAERGWRYVTIDEMVGMLSCFSRSSYITTGVLGALVRDQAQRNTLGRIDQALLNHLVPNGLKYITIGIAQK